MTYNFLYLEQVEPEIISVGSDIAGTGPVDSIFLEPNGWVRITMEDGSIIAYPPHKISFLGT